MAQSIPSACFVHPKQEFHSNNSPNHSQTLSVQLEKDLLATATVSVFFVVQFQYNW
jgi:hypothetical protein